MQARVLSVQVPPEKAEEVDRAYRTSLIPAAQRHEGFSVLRIWNVQGRYKDGRWVPERAEDLECPVCLEEVDT
jgi:hypothetical protein